MLLSMDITTESSERRLKRFSNVSNQLTSNEVQVNPNTIQSQQQQRTQRNIYEKAYSTFWKTAENNNSSD
jgi:hypothetical protein